MSALSRVKMSACLARRGRRSPGLAASQQAQQQLSGAQPPQPAAPAEAA
jgi:hypothetical protein